MLDQLSKNITRCGLSNSTLNYLRVSVREEGMLKLCHVLCSQLPDAWLPWRVGKRDLAEGL